MAWIDLRKYGQPYMIEDTGAVIDLAKEKENIIRISALGGGFEVKFITRGQMDEFLSYFTGSLHNIFDDKTK